METYDEQPQTNPLMSGIKIVEMDRGHIKVGYLERHPELAFHWRLLKARVIRNWGTSEGLAQIALDGPTTTGDNKTILDRSHNTTIAFRAVLEIIDTDEDQWRAHLPEVRTKSSPSTTRKSGRNRN